MPRKLSNTADLRRAAKVKTTTKQPATKSKTKSKTKTKTKPKPDYTYEVLAPVCQSCQQPFEVESATVCATCHSVTCCPTCGTCYFGHYLLRTHKHAIHVERDPWVPRNPDDYHEKYERPPLPFTSNPIYVKWLAGDPHASDGT